MKNEGAQAAATNGAPANADPAVLTPTRGATFDGQRREKFAAWLKDDSTSEPVVEETADAVPEETPVEAQADLEIDDSRTPEEPEPEELLEEDELQAPTPEEEAAEPEVEPAKPKGYAAKAGDEDVDLPEDLTITYKADGTERTRSLEEVIKYAQLGENFGRRSRELEQRTRDQEESHQRRTTELNTNFQKQMEEMYSTFQRFAEDEQYREEFLDEWYRLKTNPQEIELRQKARRAEELEARFREQEEQSRAQFERQVWGTVDSIISEQLADYDPELRDSMANRVRNRFHGEFTKRGNDALRESFLIDLIHDERSIIDRAVERERARVERDMGVAVQRAKAEATVETKNKTTDQALRRDKQARVVPRGGVTPSPMKTQAPIKKLSEASQRLKDWASS